MKNIFISMVKSLKNPHSIKNRLAIALIISSMIPVVLIGTISIYTITFQMENRVKGAVQSNLKQVRINVENCLNNLNYISKQLAYSETISEKFVTYMEEENIYEKYLLYNDIQKDITLISNTNPNIGTILYFSKDKNDVMFSNNPVIKDFDFQDLPLLSEDKGNLYYGPHPSVNSSVNAEVFSIVRKMDEYLLDDCYVYIETNSKMIEPLLSPDLYSINNVNHILTDYTGRIVYNSGDPEFAIGDKVNVDIKERTVQEYNGKYYFNEISRQGWNIFAVVDKQNFDRVINKWLFRFILISTLSVIMSLLFAFMIWKMISIPMEALKKEIQLMSESNYTSELKYTRVLEFDELLNKFYHMKQKVLTLLTEVEKKERTKKHLEVEKLMYQINPHFLHNTLNTIQWLAREKGQTEIACIIAHLTKVLHYNMGKEGIMVTIGEELDALKSYLMLQKVRYEDKFDIHFNIDDEALNAEIPRFILQPLVENSLYHGLSDKGGIIDIEIVRVGQKVRIIVTDNGEGMDEDEIVKYLNQEDEVDDENNKVGLGIGISYVSKMIKVTYGDNSFLDVHSKPGKTSFIIEIPYKEGIYQGRIPHLAVKEGKT